MTVEHENRQVDVIVEARMTSTRLPGKVMLNAAGKPLLEHMIERLQRIQGINNIIIATTVNNSDNCVVDLADALGVLFFRGSENDVLGRVLKAAQFFGTDIIVEITGDNPLIDPGIASSVVEAFLQREDNIDYVANDIGCYRDDVDVTFPLGFNTKVFKRKLLERVERLTDHPEDREHVVNYICKNPQVFSFYNVTAEEKYRRNDIRLTVDVYEDYQVVKAVLEVLYPDKPDFTADDIIDFLDVNEDIRNLNRHVIQRTYDYD